MSKHWKLVSEMVGGRLVLALVMVAALMTIQAIFGASTALALTERPDNTYMTNGKVYATALSADGKVLYIGGEFNKVKENRSEMSGTIYDVSNVAAINVKTGVPIRTWRPRVTGDGAVVRSLAVKNGRVYIGGNFTAVEGEPRKNLAAVGANTAAVNLLPFDPQVGGDTSYVYALEADDSKLYAGGGFSKVGGETRRNLAAFSLTTGALHPTWKPETSEAPTCTNPKCSPKVRALELGHGESSIFVGGPFSKITSSNGDGKARQSVARVYTDTGNVHPWKIPEGTIESPQTAWDLTATRNRLYGGFGAKKNFLAAFRLDRGNTGSQAWRFRTRGNVQSVALAPGRPRLFFGGHFGLNNLNQEVCHGTKRLRGLASVNPATGKLYCGFIPSLDQSRRPSYQGAWTLTTTNSYLWVGGGFIGVSDSVNPQPTGNGVTERPQTYLARFTL